MAHRDLDADRARCLVEGAPDAMALVGGGGRIVFASAQTETLQGYLDRVPNQCIEKPFDPARLRALDEMVDKR